MINGWVLAATMVSFWAGVFCFFQYDQDQDTIMAVLGSIALVIFCIGLSILLKK